jgi:hypothetical protein
MKTKLIGLIIAFIIAAGHTNAEKLVRVKAVGYDISDNLDLKAVASLFGESRNLERFERELNDPRNEISNLDLNEDGYVDYLRVVELADNRKHLVCIQAVLGKDTYQDIATIEVENDRDDYSILIVGNHFIYGPDYYIRPVYYRRPLIFSFFYSPLYRPWYSPYFWGYYPRWYKHRRPHPAFYYHKHIHVHINDRNRYDYPRYRDHHHHADLHLKIGRNDYWKKHPDKSFDKRQHEYKNRHEIDMNRRSERPNVSIHRNEEKSFKENEYKNRESRSAEQKRYTEPTHRNEPNKSVKPRSENRERTVKPSDREKSGEIRKDEPKRSYRHQEPNERRSAVVRGNNENTKAKPMAPKSGNIREKQKPTVEKSTHKSSDQRRRESYSRPAPRSENKKTESKEKSDRR